MSKVPDLSSAFEAPKPVKPRPKKKSEIMRPDLPYVRGSVLVPRGTYKRFQEIAIGESTSFQGIVEEALEAWLKARGEPAFFPTDWGGWNPSKKEQAQ